MMRGVDFLSVFICKIKIFTKYRKVITNAKLNQIIRVTATNSRETL